MNTPTPVTTAKVKAYIEAFEHLMFADAVDMLSSLADQLDAQVAEVARLTKELDHANDCLLETPERIGYADIAKERDELRVELGRVVTLPPRRYLKSRAMGDHTYSTESQGFDDCLELVEDILREAGITVK